MGEWSASDATTSSLQSGLMTKEAQFIGTVGCEEIDDTEYAAVARAGTGSQVSSTEFLFTLNDDVKN